MLCSAAWGAGGSAVAAATTPSRRAVSVVATNAALDGSALSADGFGALFFGGMISSSNNHCGRQCCSRP